MPVAKPVVTEEVIHSAGVTYRCRSSVESVAAASSASAAAETLRAVTVSGTVERGPHAADRSDVQAAAWPLYTRRRTLKVPPSVFLPASAPVRRFVAAPADVPLPSADTAALDIATESERAVFAALNDVRARPAEFGEALAAAKAQLVGKTLWTESGMALTTTEGTAAVQEAAQELIAAEPEGALRSMPLPLQLAARDHALDIGRYGLVTHRSVADDASLADRLARYGCRSSIGYQAMAFSVHAATEVVRQLVVDDGSAGRPRRALLRRPEFRHAGICLAPHAAHGAVCVIVLTGDLLPLGPALLTPRELIGRHRRMLPHLTAAPPRTCGGCWADVDPRRAVIGDRGVPYHRHCHLCRVCKSTLPEAFVCVGPDPDASLPTATSLAPPNEASVERLPGHGALPATGNDDSALPERHAYCPSCYTFRVAPKCDGCGAKLVRTTYNGDVVRAAAPGNPSLPGPSEFALNGKRLCAGCFEKGTMWMETVLDLPPLPEP